MAPDLYDVSTAAQSLQNPALALDVIETHLSTVVHFDCKPLTSRPAVALKCDAKRTVAQVRPKVDAEQFLHMVFATEHQCSVATMIGFKLRVASTGRKWRVGDVKLTRRRVHGTRECATLALTTTRECARPDGCAPCWTRHVFSSSILYYRLTSS